MMHVRQSGAWLELTSAFLRLGSSWKRIVRGEQFDGTSWREIVSFVPALSASISPSVVGGSTQTSGPVTTNEATGSPMGGQAPYSYAWTFVSGDAATINSPSAASTTFTASVDPDEAKSSVVRCTITDGIGQTAIAEITITFISLDVDLEN